jgi:hypothetical protein
MYLWAVRITIDDLGEVSRGDDRRADRSRRPDRDERRYRIVALPGVPISGLRISSSGSSARPIR